MNPSTQTKEISPTIPGGMSKRERYGWKVVDQVGEFAFIDKMKLKIDDSYQRRHRPEKITRMAAEWSWVACGAISVALREDCEWFVMDGQHRVLAARLRDDIRELPCMIFGVRSTAEEAQGFLATNTNRKAMTTVDRFKALLMTEDHAAQVVNELVLASGRRVVSGGSVGGFSAVYELLNCVREDEALMRHIWPVIVSICAPDKRIVQHLIGGMKYLEAHLVDDESLADARWHGRLLQVGYDALLLSMQQAAAFHGYSKGHKASALGIVQAVNKGLRKTLRHSIVSGA